MPNDSQSLVSTEYTKLPEYRLEQARQLSLCRLDTGEMYRLDLYIPSGIAPEKGWPSIYLLDAMGCFASCVEAMKRMARRSDATGVVDAVIVGISSGTGQHDVAIRQRDFSTHKAEMKAGGGGAEAFHDFLDGAVKSAVAQYAPLDFERTTLFGHSLAGYFTLWSMLERPLSFSNYAAISPSIWWDEMRVERGLEKLIDQGQQILITIGEWEDQLPPWQATLPNSDEVRRRRAMRAMVPTAREISQKLVRKLGAERAQFRLLAEEDHASIVSASLPRMLRIASGAIRL